MAWQYLNQGCIWARFAKSRYKISEDGSPHWNNVRTLILHLMQNSAWKLGNGNISLSRFCEVHGLTCPNEYAALSIKDGFEAPHIKISILSQLPVSDSALYANIHWNQEQDIIIWKGSKSGNFSVRDFYQSFATRHPPVDWAKCVWLSWLPPRISLFMWRVYMNGLSTDDNIRRLGIPITSRCPCCCAAEETADHIFFKGNWAKELWGFIRGHLGTQIPSSFNTFKLYWAAKFKAKNLYHCYCIGLASAGLWEIWQRRNAVIHETTTNQMSKRMHSWIIRLSALIPAGYTLERERLLLDRLLHIRIPMQKPSWVKWSPGGTGVWLHVAIVASDGSCRGGILIRDHQGLFLYGLVVPMQESSPSLEFIHSVIEGLQAAEKERIQVRHIISSHECSFNYISNRSENVPWDINSTVRNLDRDYGPLIFHRVPAIFNNAAICLAHKGSGGTHYRTLGDLPIPVQRCVKADQLGLPVLHEDDQLNSHYPGGNSVDDSLPIIRRTRGFLDDTRVRM